MNLLRLTIIAPAGGISFVAHGEALPALLKACASSPDTIDELLERGAPYYHALPAPLEHARPEESPLFRIVDDVTREASLRPVKAGAIVINLIDRRIVQIQNA